MLPQCKTFETLKSWLECVSFDPLLSYDIKEGQGIAD